MIKVQSQIQSAITLGNVIVPWATTVLNVINVRMDFIWMTIWEDVKNAIAMYQEAMTHPVIQMVNATVNPISKAANVLNVVLMIDMVTSVNYANVTSEEHRMEHVTKMDSVNARMVSKEKNVLIVMMNFTDEIVRHVNVISLVAQVRYVTNIMANVLVPLVLKDINVMIVRMAFLDQIVQYVIVTKLEVIKSAVGKKQYHYA